MFNKRTRVVINKWQKRINDKVSSFDSTLLILYGKHDLKYLHFRAVDDYLIHDEHEFNESVHHIQDNNLTVVRFDKENLMFIKPDIVIRNSDYELLKTKVTTVDELYKFIMDREVILKFHNF